MYSFLKNYSKHISVCYRIIKLLSVLTYTVTHFYANKMLTLFIFKHQPQSRLSLIKALCLKLEKLNSVYIKIFQSLALNEDLLYDDENDYSQN